MDRAVNEPETGRIFAAFLRRFPRGGGAQRRDAAGGPRVFQQRMLGSDGAERGRRFGAPGRNRRRRRSRRCRHYRDAERRAAPRRGRAHDQAERLAQRVGRVRRRDADPGRYKLSNKAWLQTRQLKRPEQRKNATLSVLPKAPALSRLPPAAASEGGWAAHRRAVAAQRAAAAVAGRRCQRSRALAERGGEPPEHGGAGPPNGGFLQLRNEATAGRPFLELQTRARRIRRRHGRCGPPPQPAAAAKPVAAAAAKPPPPPGAVRFSPYASSTRRLTGLGPPSGGLLPR